MGASCAGKSTKARELAAAIPGALVISYDQCRAELTGNPNDQSATAAAVRLAYRRVHARCAEGLPTIVDGTHTKPQERRNVVAIADRHDMPAVLVAVATPLEVCLSRQQTRAPRRPGALWGEQVPEDVVRGQHARVLASLPDLHLEGFDSVHVLNTNHLRPAAAAHVTEGTA